MVVRCELKFKKNFQFSKFGPHNLPRGLIDLLERVFSTLGLSLSTLMTSTGRNSTTNTAPKYDWYNLVRHFLMPCASIDISTISAKRLLEKYVSYSMKWES